MWWDDWNGNMFLPKMQTTKKGPLVIERKSVALSLLPFFRIVDLTCNFAESGYLLYDLANYVYSADLTQNSAAWSFLDSDLVDVSQQRAGQDVTTAMQQVLNQINSTYRTQHMNCLNNVFVFGRLCGFQEGCEVSGAELFVDYYLGDFDGVDFVEMCVILFCSSLRKPFFFIDELFFLGTSLGRSPAWHQTPARLARQVRILPSTLLHGRRGFAPAHFLVALNYDD